MLGCLAWVRTTPRKHLGYHFGVCRNFKGSSRKLGAVSDSNGVVTILDGRDEDLQVLNQLKRHAYEAWSVCWDSEDDQVLYSGSNNLPDY